MKKELGYKWYNIYTKVFFPIGIILMLFGFFINFGNYYININENPLILYIIAIDLIEFIFSVNVLINIYEKKNNPMKKIYFLLIYNWIYKTVVLALTSYKGMSTIEGGSTIGMIIVSLFWEFIICSIYYIPNIIYFYKRRENEENLIVESEEEANEFIKRIKANNNSNNTMKCKVCDKVIPYNENGTCEECHQKILDRLKSKEKKGDY